jgi:hypothetical protein
MRVWILSLLLFALPAAAQEDRGALVTALEGAVSRVQGADKKTLAAFERLEAGEFLALDNAKLTLVFFATGQQESYQGSGRLEIGPGEGKPWGLAAPVIKKLPDFLVKQIARTPTLVAQGRAGVTRLRAIATPEAIVKVEESYRRMRMESVAGDLNPEMYRLSALFEMKAFDAVESAVRDLEQLQPANKEALLLASLYRKALRNAQNAR